MNKEIENLVVKYITGQAADDEVLMVKNWINDSPANEKHYAELYEAWQESLYSNHSIDTDRAYGQVTANINRGKVARMARLRWLSVSAAAVILIACSVAFYFNFFANRTPSVVSDENVVSVPKGKTKKLLLPDGSTVWINAGSVLKFNKDFGKKLRTVYLNGEAYFEIAASKEKIPFIVKTDKFTIHDIGTVFNVKAYSEGAEFETAVFEGKVSVEGKFSANPDEKGKVFLGEKQVLKVNIPEYANKDKRVPEQIYAEVNNELIKVVEVAPSQIDEYKGWKDNFLIFDGETFQQIAADLERRYDVDIIFQSDELPRYRYSGSFRDIKNIDTVLEIIKKTTPIEYTIKGTEIAIRMKD